MQYSRSQTDATIDNMIYVAILTTSFKKIIIICDASWSIWKWLNSLRFNYVVRSSGTKALPEPSLAVCYLDSHGYISMAFYSESKHFIQEHLFQYVVCKRAPILIRFLSVYVIDMWHIFQLQKSDTHMEQKSIATESLFGASGGIVDR